MKQIEVIALTGLLLAMLMLSSCGDGGHYGKQKVYLYKQPDRDGLVCIFYGDNEAVVNENAQIFADLHKEKFGVPLLVRTEPY